MAEQDVYVCLEELIQLQHKGRGFSFLPKQPVHSLLTGRHASRLRGRGLNFEEIRHYLPGDDIRNIDWKVTARTRKPHTRVYTEERDRPAILVVDQRLSMFFGSQVRMKSVTAAEAAALAAWRVFSVGDRVGALVFNDHGMDEVRPHRSRKRVMEILGLVRRYNCALRARADIKAGAGMLNTALKRVLHSARHDYLVVVISDFEGADQQTRRLMTQLAQHNDVLAGFVYDPLEAELLASGRLVVGDGSLQLEFDSGDSKLRKRFSEAFDARLQEIREILLKRSIPVLPLVTTEGVAEQVRRQLGYAPPTRMH